MPPSPPQVKNVHISIPKTQEYVSLHHKRYFADVKSVQIHDHSKNFKKLNSQRQREEKNHTLITLIDKLR